MKKVRISALASAAALMAAPVLAMTSATAAPQDYGNVDGDRTGSLTVHKFLHQSGTAQGDISEAPAAGTFTDPVAGVEFTAYPLVKTGDSAPLDLTVANNWGLLEHLTAGANCTAPAGFTLGTPIVLPDTDTDGVASADLSVGAYQVCETDAPVNIVDTAAPFIVTVPMPYQSGWVYDVHAYPKNGATELEKTIVAQEGLGLGASVKFPVTNEIPTMKGNDWTGYAITDTLDPRLVPNPANGGVASVTLDGAALDASYYNLSVTGQTIVMEFTTAGLAWLNAEPDQTGKTIEVTFDGIVVEVGNGTIVNTAQLWPNNPGRDPNGKPPVPSNQVHTNWGALEVLKRAAGTTGAQGTLQGAVFEVYNATNPYAADCATATATGSPITVDGETQFTSNASGVVAIDGLFVSDSENPTIDAAERCYVLKEVEAPAGYVLPTDGAEFTGVAVKPGETTTADNAEIVNTQRTVPGLPLTGGQGVALLIGLGAAGLSVAGGLALLKRRREQDAAELVA